MMEDIKRETMESVTFYKSIVRVDFKPMEKVPSTSIYHRPSHRKGEVIYKRNLLTGFRKKVKKIFTEDVWMHSSYGEFVSWDNIQQHADRCDLLIIDGELYYKPIVVIESSVKDGGRTIKFDSNIEALEYMHNLKEKCKLCENTLL